MGVSKNKGTPKWMVKIMENPIKMDDLGVLLILETSIYLHMRYLFFVPALLMLSRGHKPCADDQSRKSRKAKSPRPTPRRTWEKRVGLGFFEVRSMAKIPWEKSHGKIWGEKKKKEEHQDVSGRTQDFSMD